MPKLTIDNQTIEVEAGTSILQAAQELGIEVPVFCYHPRLSVAGNCRMCLVEVEKAPKPVASCAMPVADGMVVRTNSDMVRKAREGNLEFLLINHPLDCPICDQGGECDLQDITMNYAASSSRYAENKRAVPDKYMGPLVKTSMTRCIHCTRCVRFLSEVAGVPEMGAVGRGELMEITSYLDRSLTSELSGNIIDICPVGALTSKPYAFTARPWDLTKTETIDVMDAVGSNIRVDSRGREVMRILPRLHEDVNQDWISDKTRFAYDGLKYQRLDRPYVRKNGKLVETSWDEALRTVARSVQAVTHDELAFLVGDLVDCESIFALKRLAQELGTPHLDCRQDGALIPHEQRTHYVMNTSIAGLADADACLLIGTNPRYEASLVNAALRRRFLQDNFSVGVIGPQMDLTYPVTWLGDTIDALRDIRDGKGHFAQTFAQAKRPVLFLGVHLFGRPDTQEILALVNEIVAKYRLVRSEIGWNGVNVLHTAAARVGALDLGFVPQKGGASTNDIVRKASLGEIKCLYLLGCDEVDLSQVAKSCTIIYQGHHGDRGAACADIVLPGVAYTEKDGTYVNTEGRVQRALAAVVPPGEARHDWAIIRALAAKLDKVLPFDTFDELRTAMVGYAPHLGDVDCLPHLTETFAFPVLRAVESSSSTDQRIGTADLDFYLSNSICRHSPTMAQCVQERSQHEPRVAIAAGGMR